MIFLERAFCFVGITGRTGDLIRLPKAIFHRTAVVEQIVFRNDDIHWHALDFILTCSIITAKEVPFLSSRLIREIWEVIGEWSYQMLQS